jgi:hypothetical protein
MKRFDNTKPKYSHLFEFRTLLTSFLHMRRMDLTYEVIGDHLLNLEDHKWVGDFNYMCRQAFTFVLNSSKITPNSWVAF